MFLLSSCHVLSCCDVHIVWYKLPISSSYSNRPSSPILHISPLPPRGCDGAPAAQYSDASTAVGVAYVVDTLSASKLTASLAFHTITYPYSASLGEEARHRIQYAPNPSHSLVYPKCVLIHEGWPSYTDEVIPLGLPSFFSMLLYLLVQDALKHAKPGTTIFLEAGTYHEFLKTRVRYALGNDHSAPVM